MAATRELSMETIERIIKLLQEGRSTQTVAGDVGCSQSAVSEIWTKNKENGKVVKGKTCRSTDEDVQETENSYYVWKLKMFNKVMKNKWAETEVNVYE